MLVCQKGYDNFVMQTHWLNSVLFQWNNCPAQGKKGVQPNQSAPSQDGTKKESIYSRMPSLC